MLCYFLINIGVYWKMIGIIFSNLYFLCYLVFINSLCMYFIFFVVKYEYIVLRVMYIEYMYIYL